MKYSLTRKLAAPAFLLFCAAAPSASAAPVTITGPTALALAAVVAQHSPHLPAYDRKIMARLFGGDSVFLVATKAKFSVTVDTVMCRTSNVDIAARSCDLTFKVIKKTIKGREANELFATAATAGVVAEGAAGSNIESFAKLNCTIDAKEIRQKGGAGAQCSFETGK